VLNGPLVAPQNEQRSAIGVLAGAQAENLADSLGKGDRVMVTGRLRQRSWETPEGDKRSVTELEADEVGASLKWATAKVERTSQRGNGDRGQGRERQAERGGDFNDPPPTY
jgi:single-strand DNA-binding protein